LVIVGVSILRNSANVASPTGTEAMEQTSLQQRLNERD
jgi:hypothetical protein